MLLLDAAKAIHVTTPSGVAQRHRQSQYLQATVPQLRNPSVLDTVQTVQVAATMLARATT